MTGLRARQKASRHENILDAATNLFRELGYEAVKMETIAAAAEVSIGTIYNYYQNKGDLLVAIVSLEVHDVLAEGERLINRTPRNAEQAIDALIGNYIEHSLVYLSKEMWRQAMAISTQQPDSPFGVTYAKLDIDLVEQTCRQIQKLQALNMINSNIDARTLGELIFNNTNMMFVNFVKTETTTLKALRTALRRQHKILVGALEQPTAK